MADSEEAGILVDLMCPKCRARMRSYERNGVTIDQCDECRGIFLDRGELEHLLAAEAAYNQPARAAQQAQPAPQTQPWVQQGYGDDSGHHSRSESGYRKRRRSFLGELFD